MVKEKEIQKEKTIEELMNNPAYVNYNLLLNQKNLSIQLEEIKKILLATYQVNKALTDKAYEEEETEEEKEGVLRRD
jgi:hypothetical protein